MFEKKEPSPMDSFKKSLGLEKKTTIGKISDNFNSTGTKLAAGQVPTFTEESAFSKCCPNLTMKQVKALSCVRYKALCARFNFHHPVLNALYSLLSSF
jgi:hypothetical protein